MCTWPFKGSVSLGFQAVSVRRRAQSDRGCGAEWQSDRKVGKKIGRCSGCENGIMLNRPFCNGKKRTFQN